MFRGIYHLFDVTLMPLLVFTMHVRRRCVFDEATSNETAAAHIVAPRFTKDMVERTLNLRGLILVEISQMSWYIEIPRDYVNPSMFLLISTR